MGVRGRTGVAELAYLTLTTSAGPTGFGARLGYARAGSRRAGSVGFVGHFDPNKIKGF